VVRGICLFAARHSWPFRKHPAFQEHSSGGFSSIAALFCFGNGHKLPSDRAKVFHQFGRLDAAQFSTGASKSIGAD